MSHAVASRFARALADLLTAPGAGVAPHRALEQLQAFETLLDQTPALRQVMRSPAVAAARKHALLARLEQMFGWPRVLRNFLCVLVDHRRTPLVREIRMALENDLDERLGLVKAEVTCVRELTPAQRQDLEAQLSRLAGKRARCEYTTNEAIVGGVIARIGSTVYDGSVRGQLDAIRRRLGAAE
jgi:F-type H+-transporting ATPase subunit delta